MATPPVQYVDDADLSCQSDNDCYEGEICFRHQCWEDPEAPRTGSTVSAGGGLDGQQVSCAADADCPAEHRCVANRCEAHDAGSFRAHWLGLHVAVDFAVVKGGDDVCAPSENGEYTCYVGEEPLRSDQLAMEPGTMGAIDPGLALATQRLLLSYELGVLDTATLGARIGYALGGGPDTADGKRFVPYHLELRFAFYPLSLRAPVRPYFGLGGGLAQVDVAMPVDVRDATYQQTEVDAWSKRGTGFVAPTAGLAIGFNDAVALQLNLDVLIQFPASGIAIQPSAGLVFGL